MEDSEERWRNIPEFPLYQVSNLGQVRNRETWRVLRLGINGKGVIKVNFFKDGFRTTRSVALLVAEAFVFDRDEWMNTPVHLNRDPEDNRAVNLVWRPRWFAWKYAQQFDVPKSPFRRKPIYDCTNRVWYENIEEAAMVNGLLIKDIFEALPSVNRQPTYPTRQYFSFVEE